MLRCAALLVLAVLSCGEPSTQHEPRHATTESPAAALCPAGCYCGDSLDFEVSCRAGEVWVTLEVRPRDFLRVTCDNSTVDVIWELFPSTTVLRGAGTPAVSISGCRVSRGSYGDVVRALGGRPELVRSLHVDVPAGAARARLAGLSGLTSLSLRGAPPGLLEELPALTTLRLIDTDLELGQLRGAGRLVSLEVGDARLAELPDGALSGLGGLRRLALWAVGLRSVGEGALRGAGEAEGGLRELQLSGNRQLRSLPRDLVLPAPEMRRLALHDNALEELPRGLLDGLARLRELRLSDNRGEGGLRLPGGLCADLAELTELRADRCGLRALPDDVLHGARALRELYLTGNMLSELPPGLLRDQTALRVLRLDTNRLTALSPETFSTLAALEELSLDDNQLGVLPASLVSGAGSLRVLSARHAGLHQVTAGSLRGARRLQVLLLSHNNLTLSTSTPTLPELGPSSSLGPLPELRVLDASYNAVSEVFADWRLSMLQLKLLNLTHNQVGPLQYSDVQFLSENVTVDLRHNLVTDLDLSQLELVRDAGASGAAGQGDGTTLLLLDRNPVECGCGLLGALRGAAGLRLDWGDARCDEPPALRGESVGTLAADRLTCSLTAPACPDGCECSVRPALSRLELRCNVTADSTWPSLPQPTQLGLRDMTVTLSGSAPPGRMPPAPHELSSLALSGLGVRSLHTLLPLPTALRSLDLSHNELSRPDPDQLRALLSSDRRVFLAGNTLTCSCPDLPALTVLQEHSRQIPMFSSLRCADGSPVSSASGVRLCGRGTGWVWAAGLAGLTGLGLGALLWAGRRAVRALLVVRCGLGWLRPRDELGGTDQGRDYDVFVSHAHQDEGLALQLADKLEGRRRLLLHFRDWRVGESIPAQIASSVRAARRTLVLVSPAYLASSWAALELREALLEPARLLAVVAGAPTAADMAARPELRGYLARHTYLRWGDPWFWEKLELALPPPRPAPRVSARDRAPAAARATFIDRLPGLLVPDDKPPPADITLL